MNSIGLVIEKPVMFNQTFEVVIGMLDLGKVEKIIRIYKNPSQLLSDDLILIGNTPQNKKEEVEYK